MLGEVLVDEGLVGFQFLYTARGLLRVLVHQFLRLPFEGRQLAGLRLGHGVVALVARGAGPLRGQQGAVLGRARGRRLGKDLALAAFRALDPSAEIVFARRAPLAVAPETLRVVQLHPPRRRRLQQTVFRQVRDANLVTDLDLPAATQHMVRVGVVPDGVWEARVGHEGGEEISRVSLGVVGIFEAVQDPDLQQPLHDDRIGARRDLLDDDLGGLGRLRDFIVVKQQQVVLDLGRRAREPAELGIFELLLGQGLDGAPIP
mmetsp:Transcript_47298/g.137725  ORF Transcript_47298/g.137725 Transcript_47298/m.137725 type:complete len:260 (+) Transcript_47298:474-1253(+)